MMDEFNTPTFTVNNNGHVQDPVEVLTNNWTQNGEGAKKNDAENQNGEENLVRNKFCRSLYVNHDAWSGEYLYRTREIIFSLTEKDDLVMRCASMYGF